MKENILIRTYQDLIDNSMPVNEGYYINEDSDICRTSDCHISGNSSRNISTSEKVAKSMLAMSMISQLMPYYGGEISDEEWLTNKPKYALVCGINFDNTKPRIIRTSLWTIRNFLAFHTPEQRDNFLKYNEQLVKDYLMIY